VARIKKPDFKPGNRSRALVHGCLVLAVILLGLLLLGGIVGSVLMLL
jgi:hypothetical protein